MTSVLPEPIECEPVPPFTLQLRGEAEFTAVALSSAHPNSLPPPFDELDVQPGVPFDPAFHEAVLTQESESEEEGAVCQVVESGYLLHGRLLRPAKVIVVR